MRLWMLALMALGACAQVELEGQDPQAPPAWLDDSAAPPDADPDADAGISEPDCSPQEGGLRCAHLRYTLRTTSELEPDRELRYQLPLGTPPADGWPVALLFQGSYHPARHFWHTTEDGPWGEWQQGEVVRALLGAGVAVLTPDARGAGLLYWDTNQPPWNLSWNSSPDAAMMRELLRVIDAGELGPLDGSRLLVGGLSSGGYMSSRLALEIPHRVRGAVVTGASYATCAGALCVVGPVGDAHPPTLFLHGGSDPIVPVATMRRYARALRDAGVPVRVVVPPGLGHAWPARSAAEVRAWVDAWL